MSTKHGEPNQRPEVFRRFFEDRGITVTQEAVLRFMNHAIEKPCQDQADEDARAVAALLFELVQAAKYGQSWDPFKRRLGLRKRRSNMFCPDAATIDSPAMGITLAWLQGELITKQAVSEFRQHVQPASDKQIQNWLEELKPRAQNLLDFQRKIMSMK